MQKLALVLLVSLVAAVGCSDSDDGGDESSGTGVPDECVTSLRVLTGDGDDDGGEPFDAQRIVIKIEEADSAAAATLALYGGYEPDSGNFAEDPEVPDDGRLALIGLRSSSDSVEAGTYVEDADDGELAVTSAIFWTGPDEAADGSTTITITEVTDEVVCGEIEMTSDPGVSGTFQASRRGD